MSAKSTKESGQEFFQKAAEQNVERMNTMVDELAKVEKTSIDQVEKGIDEFARLMKTSLKYSIELNEHMRNMMVESTKRTMEWMVLPRV